MLKLIFEKLLQHVSVPPDHHQGARCSYTKVTTDHLLVRYTVVLRQHAAAEVTFQKLILICVEGFKV